MKKDSSKINNIFIITCRYEQMIYKVTVVSVDRYSPINTRLKSELDIIFSLPFRFTFCVPSEFLASSRKKTFVLKSYIILTGLGQSVNA